MCVVRRGRGKQLKMLAHFFTIVQRGDTLVKFFHEIYLQHTHVKLFASIVLEQLINLVCKILYIGMNNVMVFELYTSHKLVRVFLLSS